MPAEAVRQATVALPGPGTAHRNRDGLSGADHDDEVSSAAEGRVEQVALEHDVVRGVEQEDDGGILTPLALVDRNGAGQLELLPVAPVVDHLRLVEPDTDPLLFRVPPNDPADVTV